MINTCPPGMICLDNHNIIIILVLIFIILFLLTKEYRKNLENKIYNIQTQQNKINTKIDEEKILNTKHETVVINKDRQLMTDPLLPPHRRNYYIEGPEYIAEKKGIPINISTRGYDGGFQQIGMLHRDNVADDTKQIGNNSDTNILPLFGKPQYSNSSKRLYR